MNCANIPCLRILFSIFIMVCFHTEGNKRIFAQENNFLDNLIHEMLDPVNLAKISNTTRYGLISSTNPKGAGPNFDNYVSLDEKGTAVLADLKGPGCIRRIFFSMASAMSTGRDSKWRPIWKDILGKPRKLLFFFDGEKKPRLTTTVQNLMSDLVKGKRYRPSVGRHLPSFYQYLNIKYSLRPLLGRNGNGFFSYLPIPYKKSLKITMDASDLFGFSYQIAYHKYDSVPEGMESYNRDALTAAISPVRSGLLAGINDPEVTPVEGFLLRRALIKEQKLEPGQSTKPKIIRGPGIIREIEINWVRRDTAKVRGLVLRCYWDDEKNPSIEVPVDDLFGFDHGNRVRVQLFFLDRIDGNAGERRGRIWFPMPFNKQARIIVTNENEKADGAIPFSMKLRYMRIRKLNPEFGYFHAFWSRSYIKEGRSEPHVMLDMKGAGRMIGCMLAVNKATSGRDYLETTETLTIDGKSWKGTTLDNFFNGYNGYGKKFNAAYHGVPIQRKGNVTQFRFFIPDSIPFSKSFSLKIPYAEENFTSVTFWYQKEPHQKFPALQPLAIRSKFFRRFKLKGAIEGETMKVHSQVNPNYHSISSMSMEDEEGDWSNDMQLISKYNRHAWFVVELPVEKEGSYEVVVYMTKGEGYSPIEISLDGKKCFIEGPDKKKSKIFDASKSEDFTPSGPLSIGVHQLSKGTHLLKFEKQKGANGRPVKGATQIGLDCVRLAPK